MKRLFTALVLIGLTAHASTDLGRYESIIVRSPFGKEPPAPEMPVAQPSGTFAKQYRLCMLYRGANGQLKAGLVSKTNDKSIVLELGEEDSGLSLVDVRIEEGVAILKKGNETAQILLEGLNLPASQSRPSAVASIAPAATEAQRFIRAGTSGVTDHIRTSLISAQPKTAKLSLAKRETTSSGGAGGNSDTRRPTSSSGSTRQGGGRSIGEGAVKKVAIQSNGYSVQRVPSNIKIEF